MSGEPLVELCGYCPYAGMGEQNLMDRLVGLNSKDCRLEKALCALQTTAERIQTTTGRLGWKSAVEVAVQEGQAVSTAGGADPGGRVRSERPPQR